MFEAVILTVTPELTKKEFDALFPLVTPDKQERIQKFHFFRDARNCLLGDILARVETCRFTDLSMKQIEFAVNEYEKPFVVGKPRIQFNISHAGHYIACIIADEPVGIDIELITHVDMNLAERFFTPDETAYIVNEQQANRFYEVWTKKESRIKLEGKGLNKPLSSFSIFESSNQERLVYHKIFQNDEAVCHVCSTKQESPSVRIINIATFMQYIKK